ncbi:MAG TPA: ABC transporter permease [Geothrix sp.]|nr:ABC transporter permease [Geothrix sp.]
MRLFPRLLTVEFLKLRNSAALRMAWLLPLLFLLLDFWVFERPALSVHTLSADYAITLNTMQIKLLGSLWAGFFHPLMVALLPALILRPEHRFKQWKHLHAQPVPRRGVFLAKAVVLLALMAGSLSLIGMGFSLERSLLARINPLLAFPLHGAELARILGWLWLGSLPLLTLYLWVADRIDSLAVPIVFGLLGIMLTISLSASDLSGLENPKPWKRDLIPWVLSYFCAQRAIQDVHARQDVHIAGKVFKEEPNIIKLPSGRRVRTYQPVPEDVLFPPPPPTPVWILAVFSVSAGVVLLGLGLADAGRNRN